MAVETMQCSYTVFSDIAMKDNRRLTEDQEVYLKKVISTSRRPLPKQTAKEALKAVNDLKGEAMTNSLKILGALQSSIPAHLARTSSSGTGSYLFRVFMGN